MGKRLGTDWNGVLVGRKRRKNHHDVDIDDPKVPRRMVRVVVGWNHNSHKIEDKVQRCEIQPILDP